MLNIRSKVMLLSLHCQHDCSIRELWPLINHHLYKNTTSSVSIVLHQVIISTFAPLPPFIVRPAAYIAQTPTDPCRLQWAFQSFTALLIFLFLSCTHFLHLQSSLLPFISIMLAIFDLHPVLSLDVVLQSTEKLNSNRKFQNSSHLSYHSNCLLLDSLNPSVAGSGCGKASTFHPSNICSYEL